MHRMISVKAVNEWKDGLVKILNDAIKEAVKPSSTINDCINSINKVRDIIKGLEKFNLEEKQNDG